jgi:hypothetical protein
MFMENSIILGSDKVLPQYDIFFIRQPLASLRETFFFSRPLRSSRKDRQEPICRKPYYPLTFWHTDYKITVINNRLKDNINII